MSRQMIPTQLTCLAMFLLWSATFLSAQTTSQGPALSSDAYANMNFRWLPWLGCWELLVEDTLTTSKEVPSIRNEMSAFEKRLRPNSSNHPQVCFLPDLDSPDGQGMQMITFVGPEAFLKKTLLANGIRQIFDEGNCSGWQRAEWSNDNHRLFIESRLNCNNTVQIISGVSLMTARSTWTDIQVVESSKQRELVIRHYKPTHKYSSTADGLDVLTPDRLEAAAHARRQILTSLSLNDVIEASALIAPEAVEAALLETDTELEVTRDVLTHMDKAGVPENIIDLTVALAYPDYFTVERATEASIATSRIYKPNRGNSSSGTVYPWYGSAYPGYDWAYPWYGSVYPYYVVPFSYGYWYTPRSSTIFLGNTPGVERGRVIKGNGYTRVHSVNTRTRNFHRTRNSDSNGSGRSGTSSSDSVSNDSGYRSSGGGSTGRTAKPRKKD